MDKAMKYAEKTHIQMDQLCKRNERCGLRLLLLNMRIVLLQHTAMCNLVIGKCQIAISEIAVACQFASGNQRLLACHAPQLHVLLGLYCLSMNLFSEAEVQFNTTLSLIKCVDMWTFVNLNLASLLLHSGREQEFLNFQDSIAPERLQTPSQNLKAASLFVKGFHAFIQQQYNDAKKYLRDALALADKEDMNRVSCCALVLLGYLFLATSNFKDSLNMINPAMQVARSIPDVSIQVWGAGLLRDIYLSCKDNTKENECAIFQSTISQMLLDDRCQSLASPVHQLIHWIQGIPRVDLRRPNSNGFSTTAEVMDSSMNLIDY